MSQLYYLKNPLIRRGVKVSSYYVFGRGVEISCEDSTADDTLKAFLRETPTMPMKLSHSGLVQKEETLHTDGNLFFVFFSDTSTGQVKIRTISALEIQDIVCDRTTPRAAVLPSHLDTESVRPSIAGGVKMLTQECWYPDADHQPATRPSQIGGKPVMWDSPIIHAAVGKLPKWKFGVPDVYAALDWSRAVKDYLEDWSTIQRANRRIAMDIETKGGLPAIAAYQAASPDDSRQSNQPRFRYQPTAGSRLTHPRHRYHR